VTSFSVVLGAGGIALVPGTVGIGASVRARPLSVPEPPGRKKAGRVVLASAHSCGIAKM